MSAQKKKPVKKAVALQYQPSKHAAPVVTAKGQGFVAEKIIALAKKENIPIKDDPDLVQVLSQMDLDEQIPPAVYQVVAEIFSFIYHLNTKHQKKNA
jgi:flagellar biosynthesis protein